MDHAILASAVLSVPEIVVNVPMHAPVMQFRRRWSKGSIFGWLLLVMFYFCKAFDQPLATAVWHCATHAALLLGDADTSSNHPAKVLPKVIMAKCGSEIFTGHSSTRFDTKFRDRDSLRDRFLRTCVYHLPNIDSEYSLKGI